VAAVGLVTLANLRGIRESGSIFAVPIYVFLAAMFAMVGGGLYLHITGQLFVPPPDNLPPPTEALSLFLVLRAFAVGSIGAIEVGLTADLCGRSGDLAHPSRCTNPVGADVPT